MSDQFDEPILTIEIDPDRLDGGRPGTSRTGKDGLPRIDITEVTGVDLTRLDLPHMLEVLRGVYTEEDNRLVHLPRSYRVSSGEGVITDLQASLYSRFQADQQHINRLLDQLEPMRADADLEDCDAIRELVRLSVGEIVEEVRRQGGPLNGKLESSISKASAHLKELEKRFGMKKGQVNTQADADNFTRYITIKHLLRQMESSWKALRSDFDRSATESFGSGLVWLNRLLASVNESATHLRFQLKRYLVSEADLASKWIPGAGKTGKFTIAELLDWTDEVCERGAFISLRAGKDAISLSLSKDLRELKKAYQTLVNIGTYPIPALARPDVQTRIVEILDALNKAIMRTATYRRKKVNLNPVTLNIQNPAVAHNGKPQIVVIAPDKPGNVINVLYAGSSNPPSEPGTYEIKADFIPDDEMKDESLAGRIVGLFTIKDQQVPTLAIKTASLPYTGSPRMADVIAKANIKGTVRNVQYNGSPTPPTNAGTYAVTADFIPDDPATYTRLAGVSAGNFTVTPIVPRLSISNSPVIETGAPQSADIESSVPGKIDNVLYNDKTPLPSNAGTYKVKADFTPDDAVNYTTIKKGPVGDFIIQPAPGASSPQLKSTSS
jgi:hypothetical protein